jgi:hypothetical protein
MLPVAALVLATIYQIGARLFSPRVGWWGTLLAASFPDFYTKLGEYRPDLFWAALWLIELAILTGGETRRWAALCCRFRNRRCFRRFYEDYVPVAKFVSGRTRALVPPLQELTRP